MSYWEGRLRQYCPIGDQLNFFCERTPKNAKKCIFLYFPMYSTFWCRRPYMDSTMRKLTSWRFQKCVTYRGSEFLNGSYCCSKSGDQEKCPQKLVFSGLKFGRNHLFDPFQKYWPPHDIHGWKARDLSFLMVFSKKKILILLAVRISVTHPDRFLNSSLHCVLHDWLLSDYWILSVDSI